MLLGLPVKHLPVIFGLLLAALPAMANDWDSLKTPGAIAIMRHALAPGGSDPAGFTLGECATQRNLDDRGRDQATRTGAALRARGVVFDTVFTSQWCRTRETAELLDVGPVVEAPALNSFFDDRSTRDSQTRDTAQLLGDTPGRLMLVTHQVNISALAGRSTRSGEILVIVPQGDSFQVIGSILIAP